MDILRSDPAIYVSCEGKDENGLYWTYVEDILRVGVKKFRKIPQKTHERFDMADDE